jgi:hypothetical protein
MDGDAAKDGWVVRVLGIDLQRRNQSGDEALEDAKAPDGATPRVIWQTAKEAVDMRLEQLAGALRSYNHPDLDRIADFGLFGLTRGESVALNRALIEYDAAPTSRKPAAGSQLQQAVGAFRAVLTQHPAIVQLDKNPFGVRPAMRATLSGALDRIEQAIG